jgi:hypothetical protein
MALEHLEVVPVEDAVRVVYRVVATADRNEAAFVDSFKSSHALGLPPRQGSPEERFGLIHAGISCFNTRRQAERIAQRWGLGSYIAEVHLAPGAGICLAKWGSAGHMTVWADPVKLAAMTVDIVSVEEG